MLALDTLKTPSLFSHSKSSEFSNDATLKIGYEVLWLSGVALAPGQIRETYIISPATVRTLGVNCDSNVLFTELPQGFEFSFKKNSDAMLLTFLGVKMTLLIIKKWRECFMKKHLMGSKNIFSFLMSMLIFPLAGISRKCHPNISPARRNTLLLPMFLRRSRGRSCLVQNPPVPIHLDEISKYKQ